MTKIKVPDGPLTLWICHCYLDSETHYDTICLTEDVANGEAEKTERECALDDGEPTYRCYTYPVYLDYDSGIFQGYYGRDGNESRGTDIPSLFRDI